MSKSRKKYGFPRFFSKLKKLRADQGLTPSPQYRIECMLGHGGMGAVYKGLQPELDRPVAIKLLPAELSADEQFVSRFKREARTLARLHHPGIVAVYAFGQTSEGHLYFVMEYVAGTDLRRVLQGPGLNPDQAFELIGQICEALQAAHEQGVIHRDIKPANILLAGNGRVKLADFGLSRPQQEDDLAGLTMSNMIMGTPDYMSPEQRSGYSDHRTDIYALGIMLYEMLTGRPPRGAFVPVSRKIQVDVRIDEVVLKALQEEPELRYQQVSELKTDLDRIRTSTDAPKVVPPVIAPRRRMSFTAIFLLLMLLLLGGFLIWKNRPQAPANPPTVAKAETAPTPATPSATQIKIVEQALVSYLWQWISSQGEDSNIRFLPDGTVKIPKTKAVYRWVVTGPKTFTLELIENENGKIDDRANAASFTFDEAFTSFAGHNPWLPRREEVFIGIRSSLFIPAAEVAKETAPPPAATPEPKATPSPMPDVMAWLLEKKERWPKEVKLTRPITFPVFVGGKAAGSAQAPAGAMATVTNLQAGQVTLLWVKSTKTVPVDATDLLARASDSLAISQPAPVTPTVALANKKKPTVAPCIIVPLTAHAFRESSLMEPWISERVRLMSEGSGFAEALREKPASQIKSEPNLQNPTYFRFPLGNREFLAILDVGKDAEKATLYIDFDGQGLFKAIKGIEGVDKSPARSSANFQFGPITLPKTKETVAGPFEVLVSCYVRNKKDANMVDRPIIYAQKFVAGKLRIGSEEYAVAFVDGSFVGRFQTFNPSIEQSARARDQRFGATRMGVDLDKNGKFDFYKEAFPLVDLVRINDKYYRVSIAPDGSEAKFQETKPEVGVLDTKCPGMEMSVISDKCAALLTANADGEWELPPGKYHNRCFALSRMVNDKKWTLDGSNQSTQARYFEIKAGTPTVLPLGPPLALSYSVDKTAGGSVSIGLKVAGISGEIYSSVSPAPQVTFTITSETGENLAQGKFEHRLIYGGYSSSWQVPPDFTGGFRIQTKANLGPFEYKQSDQILHLK